MSIAVIGEEQIGKSTFIKTTTGIPFKVSEVEGNRTTEGVLYATT